MAQETQVKPIKGSNRWQLWLPPAGAAALLLLSSALPIACSANKSTENTPTPSPTVAARPTSTATATSTPEAKRDIPCTILPDQYCSKAELVERISATGKSGYVIALNLPAGVPIFSPMDGEVSNAKTSYGLLAVINDYNDPTGLAFGIHGDIRLTSMLTVKVRKGDVIGYTQDTEHFPSPLGNYTLGIGSTKRTPDGSKLVEDPDALKTLFPEAFSRGTVSTVVISSSGSSTTYLSPAFR